MSMLNDMLEQFKKRDVSDFEIDRLIAKAEKIAADNSSDTKALELLSEIRSVAAEKKMNQDIWVVENINDSEELRATVSNYTSRVERNPDAANRIKLYDLSDRMLVFARAGVDIDAAADVMTRYLDSYADEKDAAECAKDVIAAYSESCRLEKTPAEARKMYKNLDKLSDLAGGPKYEYFMNSVCCLEDKRTAEVFLKYLSKSLDGDVSVFDGGRISDICSQVVVAHPEMAKACIEVVNKSLEAQSPYEHNYVGRGMALEKAAEFYGRVNNSSDVKEEDKSLARIKKKGVEKEIEKRHKPFLEGKRVILSPDKPPRAVPEATFRRTQEKHGGR